MEINVCSLTYLEEDWEAWSKLGKINKRWKHNVVVLNLENYVLCSIARSEIRGGGGEKLPEV